MLFFLCIYHVFDTTFFCQKRLVGQTTNNKVVKIIKNVVWGQAISVQGFLAVT